MVVHFSTAYFRIRREGKGTTMGGAEIGFNLIPLEIAVD